MKRKVMISLMLPFLLLGCSSNEKKNTTTDPIPEDKTVVNDEPQEKEPTKEEDNTPVKTETFLKENYISFPKVKNIVQYLKLSPKKVKIISQTNKKLVFCFTENVTDEQNESVPSVANYVRGLEKDGYKMNLLDGTISQTFVLEKEDIKLSITSISVLDEWKKVHKDELDTKKITTENTVCEVSIK